MKLNEPRKQKIDVEFLAVDTAYKGIFNTKDYIMSSL